MCAARHCIPLSLTYLKHSWEQDIDYLRQLLQCGEERGELVRPDDVEVEEPGQLVLMTNDETPGLVVFCT